MQGYFAEQDEGSAAQAPLDPTEQPEEKLAFALGDGRVGILAVKGRKVTTPRLPLLFPSSLPSSPPSPSFLAPLKTHFSPALLPLLFFCVLPPSLSTLSCFASSPGLPVCPPPSCPLQAVMPSPTPYLTILIQPQAWLRRYPTAVEGTLCHCTKHLNQNPVLLKDVFCQLHMVSRCMLAQDATPTRTLQWYKLSAQWQRYHDKSIDGRARRWADSCPAAPLNML